MSAISGIVFTALALIIPATAAIHVPFIDLMTFTRVELVLPYTVLFIALLGISNAIVWPAIWPLAIHSLGRFIKTGSALLIMAIAGGAILPLIWGYLSNVWSAQMAYSIAIPCYLFILYYAVYGHKVKEVEMKPKLFTHTCQPGIGSRYGGLKQADGVGPSGEAILDYSIFDAIRAGFGKVVFVIRKDIEDDMKRIFFDRWSKKIEIDYVFQEVNNLPGGFQSPADRTKPWGTGHAIWVAKEKVHEPFCVINADDFYGRGAYQLAYKFQSDLDNLINSRYCLIGYVLKNSLSDHGFVSRAECRIDENGMLSYVKERTKIKREGNKVFFEDDNGTRIGNRRKYHRFDEYVGIYAVFI